VPAVPEPYSTPPGTIPSTHSHFGPDCNYIEIEERGTDNTVEVLGIINTFTESECMRKLFLNYVIDKFNIFLVAEGWIIL